MTLSRFLRPTRNDQPRPAPPATTGDRPVPAREIESPRAFNVRACICDPASIIESWVAEAEVTGKTDSYLGKRHWPRFTWNVDVQVHVKSGPLADQTLTARTKNVSLGGMGIQVRTVLPAGTRVELLIEDRPVGVEATVVHCTRMITGYLLGVCFIYPS